MPGLAVIDDSNGNITNVGVDGVAEQDQLDQRDHDDHAEGHPIPAQLAELLEEDGRYP